MEPLSTIKRIIEEEASRLNIKIERIILFGSRAKGTERKDSDYDILVITKGQLLWRKKMTFYRNVHRRLVGLLNSPVDLLIVPSEWFWQHAKMPTSFEAEVMETGKELSV